MLTELTWLDLAAFGRSGEADFARLAWLTQLQRLNLGGCAGFNRVPFACLALLACPRQLIVAQCAYIGNATLKACAR